MAAIFNGLDMIYLSVTGRTQTILWHLGKFPRVHPFLPATGRTAYHEKNGEPMVTTVPVYIIDAFTDQPFRGNPAGVVLLEKPASDAWMQNVAMEMNQAETAFVVPAEKGYHLRWFTPTVEVDLCGHATLAAASILWRTHKVPKTETISFHTKSGWLHCTRQEETIQLDFPARKV